MPVQDDERERELVRVFNLDWDSAHQRGGVDAILDVEIEGKNYQFEVEVKSTTGTTVSTARDVGMDHIQKWRRKIFVIGYYTKEARRPELKSCLCLTPLDMEPWIASIEQKISTDFKIALRASCLLTEVDLFEVCGQRSSYSLKDAKKLHKKQWTNDQYDAALDIVENGQKKISKLKMLEILQLRAKYIAERGATLNNPHITKVHLDNFLGTTREMKDTSGASSIRSIVTDFIKSNPDHPSITLIP
jgi:hypothetical protein